MFNDKLYEYCALQMGLRTVPRIVTKIMGPVVARLLKNGSISNIFLDDLLLLRVSKLKCKRNITETI